MYSIGYWHYLRYIDIIIYSIYYWHYMHSCIIRHHLRTYIIRHYPKRI